MFKKIFLLVVTVVLLTSTALAQKTPVSQLPAGPSINDAGEMIFWYSDAKALVNPVPSTIEVSGNWLKGNTGWETVTLSLIEYKDSEGQIAHLYYGKTGVGTSPSPTLSFSLAGTYFPQIAIDNKYPGLIQDYVVHNGANANYKPPVLNWRIE